MSHLFHRRLRSQSDLLSLETISLSFHNAECAMATNRSEIWITLRIAERALTIIINLTDIDRATAKSRNTKCSTQKQKAGLRLPIKAVIIKQNSRTFAPIKLEIWGKTRDDCQIARKQIDWVYTTIAQFHH